MISAFSASRQDRPTISFGPEYRRPSWEWIGFNLARASASRYNVRLFRPGEPIAPDSSILVVIRKPLPPATLRQLPATLNIIYAPFDYHTSLRELAADPFLRRAQAIIAHSQKQREIISRFHPNVHYLLHDDKYVLPDDHEPAEFRHAGPILWIGRSTLLPLLRAWLAAHPFAGPQQVVALTDNPERVPAPGNLLQVPWTPVNRYHWMKRARAALDLRGDSFQQILNPVEKIHTLLASGIPTACDGKIEVLSALRSEGFELAHARDTQHWLSRAYFDQTAAFAPVLRERMQLSSIASAFQEVIDSL
jgi:hypothetical protein